MQQIIYAVLFVVVYFQPPVGGVMRAYFPVSTAERVQKTVQRPYVVNVNPNHNVLFCSVAESAVSKATFNRLKMRNSVYRHTQFADFNVDVAVVYLRIFVSNHKKPPLFC